MPSDLNALDMLSELSEVLQHAFQVVAQLQHSFSEEPPLAGSSSPRVSFGTVGKAKKPKSKSRKGVTIAETSAETSALGTPVLPFSVPEEEAVCHEESIEPGRGLSNESVPRASSSSHMSKGGEEEQGAQGSQRGLSSPSSPSSDRLPFFAPAGSGLKHSRRAPPRPQGRAQTSQSADGPAAGKEETPRMRAVQSDRAGLDRPVHAISFTPVVGIHPRVASEEFLNNHIFRAAGLNIQPAQGAGGVKASNLKPIQKKPIEEVSCTLITPVKPTPEGGASPRSAFGEESVVNTKSNANRSMKRCATLGNSAAIALQEQEDQAVANLQAEAQPEYQVFGREVLWNPSHQEDEELAQRSRCRSAWLVAGTTAYTTLIKLGGLSPLWPERSLASKSYAAAVCVVVAWAALHPLALASLDPDATSAVSTEVLLEVGAALSLLLLTIQRREWALAETSQRLSIMAHQAGFLNALARSSCLSTGILVALTIFASGFRLFDFLIVFEQGDLASRLPSLISSLVAFFTLTCQALYLHRIAAALTGTVDHFTTNMVHGQAASKGREEWKLTMALCSEVNKSLQRGLLVLQLMLTAFLPLLAFELKIRATSFLQTMPSMIMALIVLSAFWRISIIATQCQSIPSMLGRLPVEDETQDSGMISLMARIRDTSAPVQILGVGITPGLVCKTFYTVGTVTIFLVLNFQKELGTFYH